MEDVNSIFLARPTGERVLAEYLPCIKQIVIASEIMESSKVTRALQTLAKVRTPSIRANATILLEHAMFTAFKKRDGYVAVPEVDYHGNLIHDIQTLCSSLTWEGDYIYAALKVLTEGKDEELLTTMLGIIGHAYRQSEAHKRTAFATVVTTAAAMLQTQNSLEGTVSEEDTTAAHKERVKAHCTTFIDDLKERAFQSVFLQPTMMYFDSVYDSATSGDVDVHGSNTYLTILQATTGIHIPRLPFVYDEAKGIANVAGAGITGTLEMLHLPEHVGKSYQSVLRSHDLPHSTIRVSHGKFIFNVINEGGGQAIDLAFASIDNSARNATNRSYYATQYLTPYAHYFSEEVILPWLVHACLQDETVAASLQAVFEEMKGREEIVNDLMSKTGLVISDFETVKECVWNDNETPPRFRANAARAIFAACGVCKAIGVEIEYDPEMTKAARKHSNSQTVVVSPTTIPSETTEAPTSTTPTEESSTESTPSPAEDHTVRERSTSIFQRITEAVNNVLHHPQQG